MATKLPAADPASQQMAAKAEADNVTTVWDRYASMSPQCKFGSLGICCRICSMGPCRLDPNGKKNRVGVCGADYDTIVARNLSRMVAGGAAAHSDHGRGIAHTLHLTATDPEAGYSIKDPVKLRKVAAVYGIPVDGQSDTEIAREVAAAALNDFGQAEGEVKMALTAPPERIKLWRKAGVMPRAIDREVVEVMHRTHIGVDADYRSLIKHSMRAALADGWGGSMIATEISDIILGSPNPVRADANLGVLRKENVNILVHGHEPTLSDMIAVVSQDPELVAKAKEAGADGITVAGICCTANEVLMRHGIPVAGSFLQQELAIVTGAVELMVVDVQCVMPALSELTQCYHTKLVTTSPKAKIRGAQHIEFDESRALETAKQIITEAIDNFANRKKEKVEIPEHSEQVVAGFTTESVFRFLGGTYRATYRPLNDAIIAGRLRGAAGVIGCSNPNMEFEEAHLKMVKELLANDTIVVTTGCNAITCGKHGLLKPEAAMEHAGKGLREVCEAVGIPPVLHVGSCVDNSRILQVLTEILKEGGLGDDISDLPAAGAAPEWMSEKAVSIGSYFVASGVYTAICRPLPVEGSVNVLNYLTDEVEKEFGGKWAFIADPVEAAHGMLDHIDKKRAALKLKPMLYPQTYTAGARA